MNSPYFHDSCLPVYVIASGPSSVEGDCSSQANKSNKRAKTGQGNGTAALIANARDLVAGDLGLRQSKRLAPAPAPAPAPTLLPVAAASTETNGADAAANSSTVALPTSKVRSLMLQLLFFCLPLISDLFFAAQRRRSTKVTVVTIPGMIEVFQEEILTGDKAREAWTNRLMALQKITIRYSPTPESDTVMIYTHDNVVAGFAYIVVEDPLEEDLDNKDSRSSNDIIMSTDHPHTYIDLLWTNPKLRCQAFGTQMVMKIKQHFSNCLLILDSVYEALPFWIKMDFQTSDSAFNAR